MSAQMLFIHSELDEYGLTPDEFRIVCRIARRGECTESAPGMAEGCKIGERTVRLVLRVLAAANIIEEENRSGQSTIRRIAPREKWKAAAKLDGIRLAVTAGWKKKDVLGDSDAIAEPQSTPATVAALAADATPAMGAVDPCKPCSPTPATVAAKGNPMKVIPEGKELPNGNGQARAPTADELGAFKRRDDLMAYLKTKTNGHPIGNPQAEKAAALWLVKHSGFSDEQIRECLDSQWSEEWRKKVGWISVKSEIARYFAPKQKQPRKAVIPG